MWAHSLMTVSAAAVQSSYLTNALQRCFEGWNRRPRIFHARNGRAGSTFGVFEVTSGLFLSANYLTARLFLTADWFSTLRL